MTAVTRDSDENGDPVYKISAGLVHKTILAIIGSIISIAFYMVLWAIGDGAWRTGMLSRMAEVEKDVVAIEVRIAEGQLPLARQRLDAMEWQLKQLQIEHSKSTGREDRR